MESSLENEIELFEKFLIENKDRKYFEKKAQDKYLEILFKIYEISDNEEYTYYRDLLRGVIDRNWSDMIWQRKKANATTAVSTE